MAVTIDGSASVTINSGAVLGITSGTAVASTSGTSIDFTGIPSYVKRITVMFNGVSTSSTSAIQIQIGAGSIDATSYTGSGSNIDSAVGSSNNTTGYRVESAGTAAFVRNGAVFLSSYGSNIWTMTSTLGRSDAIGTLLGGGIKTLSGTLDRVRITTVNGTDTFDAGSINILYE